MAAGAISAVCGHPLADGGPDFGWWRRRGRLGRLRGRAGQRRHRRCRGRGADLRQDARLEQGPVGLRASLDPGFQQGAFGQLDQHDLLSDRQVQSFRFAIQVFHPDGHAPWWRQPVRLRPGMVPALSQCRQIGAGCDFGTLTPGRPGQPAFHVHFIDQCQPGCRCRPILGGSPPLPGLVLAAHDRLTPPRLFQAPGAQRIDRRRSKSPTRLGLLEPAVLGGSRQGMQAGVHGIQEGSLQAGQQSRQRWVGSHAGRHGTDGSGRGVHDGCSVGEMEAASSGGRCRASRPPKRPGGLFRPAQPARTDAAWHDGRDQPRPGRIG